MRLLHRYVSHCIIRKVDCVYLLSVVPSLSLTLFILFIHRNGELCTVRDKLRKPEQTCLETTFEFQNSNKQDKYIQSSFNAS